MLYTTSLAVPAREVARQKTRLAALRRLDKHIKPEDLSATLEAHRDSNRASVIRRCITDTDPDVTRPSFLTDKVPIRRMVTRNAEAQAYREESALAESKRIITNVYNTTDDAKAFQLRSLNRAAEAAEREEAEKPKRVHNDSQYHQWLEFLKKHEESLGPLPRYKFADRAAFFSVMRRVLSILGREQNAVRTFSYMDDLAPRSFMDHHGFARPLIPGLKSYPRQETWSRRPKSSCPKPYIHTWLATEINAFAKWMDMTPSETAARAKLSDTLIDLIQQADPVLQAETFGSQLTGLTMPNSDIDIRITDTTHEHIPYQGDPSDKAAKAAWGTGQAALRKQRMISHLRTIQASIAKHEDFDNVEVTDAFFPLVRAVHIHTGLKVQIVSTKDSSASREATKKYLTEYPTLKPIFLVLKTALHMRNMSDPWFGGFGSYTLFMMCVAALKHGNQQNLQKGRQKRSLALDFLHTLNFWASFDTQRFSLTVEPFAIIRQETKLDPAVVEENKTDPAFWARNRIAQPRAYRTWMLHLQDPADPWNDLGRSALAIKDLQATFAKLYDDLAWEMQDPNRKKEATALIKNIVGKSERYFDEMRIPVDLWGSQFVEEVEGEMDEVVEEQVHGKRREVSYGRRRGERTEDLLRDVVDERISSRRVLE
ncbi:hypothetical protein E4T52_05976 [Aureobasidium sp. EXF-3400]|nr:hypothetical protein E4T51_05178 [Aureobasidium sp. EXF-12344]KAI4779081.1 hypothetical protein E4T52_05976 [Aureobasidium sp. EXF-3400]